MSLEPSNESKSDNQSILLEKVTELKKLDKTLVVFNKLISIFQNEHTHRIPEMKACCENGDLENLSQIIHRFKSTTYNLGASRAADLATQIEQAIATESPCPLKIMQLITSLEIECITADKVLLTFVA